MKRTIWLLAFLGILNTGAIIAQGSLLGTWQRLSDYWSLNEYAPGNSGRTVRASNGSFEERWCVTNPGIARPCWRNLYQIYGGVEIQNASDENYSDAHSKIALNPQTNTTLEIAYEGARVHATNLDGGFYVHSYDGINRLGGIRVVPNGIGGFQMIISVRNTVGQMVDVAAFDPSIDPSGALAIMADGGQHRLRRRSDTVATLE